MRALIAEDEFVLANNIKICLEHEEFEHERFEVDIAENGAVAMRLIQNDYDVVILDLKMPEVDGTQIVEATCRRATNRRPSTMSFNQADPTTTKRLKLSSKSMARS